MTTSPLVTAAAEAIDATAIRHSICRDLGALHRDEMAAASVVATLRHLAKEVIAEDFWQVIGHDDRCGYGPPGECDCHIGVFYRWLTGRAAEIEAAA